MEQEPRIELQGSGQGRRTYMVSTRCHGMQETPIHQKLCPPRSLLRRPGTMPPPARPTASSHCFLGAIGIWEDIGLDLNAEEDVAISTVQGGTLACHAGRHAIKLDQRGAATNALHCLVASGQGG